VYFIESVNFNLMYLWIIMLVLAGSFCWYEQEECQNYIRVIARQPRNRLLVCGTNAFRPFCRTYEYMQVLYLDVLICVVLA